jgi:hypothetical protein
MLNLDIREQRGQAMVSLHGSVQENRLMGFLKTCISVPVKQNHKFKPCFFPGSRLISSPPEEYLVTIHTLALFRVNAGPAKAALFHWKQRS